MSRTGRMMKIELLNEVDSTNLYIKKYVAGSEDVIVCASKQTGGRGTKGRSFFSQEGGVYLSALSFYRDLPAERAFCIMTHAAVAVCRTAERFGVAPEIKWPNDVLVSGRKLCGILIENGISDGKVKYSIVGIGLNAENDLSALNGIAVSLSEAAGRVVPAAAARDGLIENLQKHDSFGEYLSYIRFIGREVTVTEDGRVYRAAARGVLADGRLEIEENGMIRALSAAEISLKI